MKSIIEYWYKRLEFPKEYDQEFYQALEEIQVCEGAKFEDYDLNETNGKKNLLYFLYFCEELKEKYDVLGMPEEVMVATAKDIVNWCVIWSGVKGELCLYEISWLKHHFSMLLFRLGRLQFCMGKSFCDIPEYNVKEGDNVMEIHIAEGPPLRYEDCLESIEMAKEFFAKYYPNFEYTCFTCYSWLMDQTLKSFLKEESNVVKFQKMFDIVKADADYSALRYVFGWDTTMENLKNAKADSSLSRSMKEYILSGGKLYLGLGVIEKKDNFLKNTLQKTFIVV